MKYKHFLDAKTYNHKSTGLKIPKDKVNNMLYEFQKDIVIKSLAAGKYAIFADCGMGKTPMQLEWANHIPGKVLILAPLAVAHQTVREGAKFGVKLKYCRSQDEIDCKISITNYEMMEKFDASGFEGVILDESSILKSFAGKYRTAIIDNFHKTSYKLACTATPSPNDYMELGNHSEFLNVMSRAEMLAMFFVHDGAETQKWRLKGHAQDKFWDWICRWATMISKPSDMGYDDAGFSLPPVKYHRVSVDAGKLDGFLFPMEAHTLQERVEARRNSTEERVEKMAQMINKSDECWIVWCNMNAESSQAAKAIRGAVEITGSDKLEDKTQRMLDFTEGKIRVLISKPSISGFGMNWQHCHNIAFLGLSDSYEMFYQAMRRCWRFGQKHEVNCHIVTSKQEGAVLQNIREKEGRAIEMTKNMVHHMSCFDKEVNRTDSSYKTAKGSGDKWQLGLGDCVELAQKIPDDSIHYSVFSPPFASLYTYSNSERDMGNCKTHDEFYTHFRFLVDELYRMIMPGRLVSFHCMNLPTSKQRDGFIGIKDFRGNLIKMFEEAGFIYHSEVCIWKDPVIAMQRTKALGLLHKQLKKDSTMSRQGIPDYLVTMRKKGDNPEPVAHTNESFPVKIWQRYASPIWMDINPSKTLQYRSAREHNDERHICPLQLQVIERAIALWTNPDDVVFSPFAGIGSEGYIAVKGERRFIGIELKESYYKQAVKNLKSAEHQSKEQKLF